jgi:hypothetical protein
MARAKVNWKVLDLSQVSGTPALNPEPCTSRVPVEKGAMPAEKSRVPMGLFVKTNCIADVVEAFAALDFMWHVCVVELQDDLLDIAAVVELASSGGPPVRGIVIASNSRRLPASIRQCKEFVPPGSPCPLHVVDLRTLNVVHRVDPLCSEHAIHCAAAAVNTRVYYPCELASFRDTVSSRVSMFLRKHSAQREREQAVEPFTKPEFRKVDELLYAFATHAFDNERNEYALPATGDESVPRSALRPLVFAHPLLSVV